MDPIRYKYTKGDDGKFHKSPMTQAEIEAEDAEFAPMKAVHEAAEKIGLGKGSGGVGACPCPRCRTGTINFRVASSNGHMWGACTTQGCAQ
jgi:hypothetical protein